MMDTEMGDKCEIVELLIGVLENNIRYAEITGAVLGYDSVRVYLSTLTTPIEFHITPNAIHVATLERPVHTLFNKGELLQTLRKYEGIFCR